MHYFPASADKYQHPDLGKCCCCCKEFGLIFRRKNFAWSDCFGGSIISSVQIALFRSFHNGIDRPS